MKPRHATVVRGTGVLSIFSWLDWDVMMVFCHTWSLLFMEAWHFVLLSVK